MIFNPLFAIQIGPLAIEYDRDYGLDKRRGWSVVYCGSVCAELQPWLVMAIYKAIPQIRNIRQFLREAREKA